MKRITIQELRRDKRKDSGSNPGRDGPTHRSTEDAPTAKRLRANTRKRLVPRISRPALKEGGRARLRWAPDWTGKIIRLGPEQSEIRFDSGDFKGAFRVYPTDHFEAIEEE